jgi:beta-galactosidase
VASEEIRTAGAPAVLHLDADRPILRADTREVVHLFVEVMDASGSVVPEADATISFDVQGAGRLLAVDNGDPFSHESYQGTSRKAFHGLALALVQAGAGGGEIRITASAPGLKPAAIVLRVVKDPDSVPPVIIDLDR